MDEITPDEVEAIDTMLDRYTDHFELDKLNEEPEHGEMYDRVWDAYIKVKPTPPKVDPKKLKLITKTEKEGIKDLIDSLVGIFEYVGVTPDEWHDFQSLCCFYKKLDPSWKAPEMIRLAVKVD